MYTRLKRHLLFLFNNISEYLDCTKVSPPQTAKVSGDILWKFYIKVFINRSTSWNHNSRIFLDLLFVDLV